MKMIGIIDDFGIESFMPLEGNSNQALMLIIRAKVNFHRNEIFYCLDLTDKEINRINHLVGSHEVKSFNEAGIIILKKLSKNAKIEKLLDRFYKLRERIK